MLCDICQQGLEGIWDPSRSKRLGTYTELFGSGEKAPDPADLPPNVWSVQEKDTAPKLEPELYVFGHHVDFESFDRSRRRGCVMCNRFRPMKEDIERNPVLRGLGYFSVFTVRLGGSCRLMSVHYGDTQGAFEIVPYTGMTFHPL